METLRNKIKEIAAKAKKYAEQNVNEPATKSGLIEPLFLEIGWDFTDFDHVEPEFPVLIDGDSKPVDYALKIKEKPVIFLEAKRINVDLQGAIKDGVKKALKQRVPWLIATNGNSIAVLKIDKNIPEPERTVFQIELSKTVDDESELAVDTNSLMLLSPENVSSGALENFAINQLRKTRIANAIQEVIGSAGFQKTIQEAIQEKYKKLYAGEKANAKLLKAMVKKINIGIELEKVAPTGKPRVTDTERIKKRLNQLMSYPSKQQKKVIQRNIVEKAELWLEFIARKEMSSKEFKEFAEFKTKATGGFSAWMMINGLATKVGYDEIRRGAIFRINEEIIPWIKKILGV
jgi:predicted type IV restriction endonuclease